MQEIIVENEIMTFESPEIASPAELSKLTQLNQSVSEIKAQIVRDFHGDVTCI